MEHASSASLEEAPARRPVLDGFPLRYNARLPRDRSRRCQEVTQ